MSKKIEEKVFELSIIGCIASDSEITEDEFLDKFIDFVESNGWRYGGQVEKVESNDEQEKSS